MAQQGELKLALSAAPTSLDPHFYNISPNLNLAEHIFESLVKMNPDVQPVPGLAKSWKMVDKLTWEFELRPDVRFHDGSLLTTEDVLWSLQRPATIVGSPGNFAVYTKAIVSARAVGTHTIQLTTGQPYPLLLSDLAAIAILSKRATNGLASEDFSNGKGLVGTGPYKFERFVRDDRVELARFDAYWGPRPAWSKVTLRFIPNNAARLAALLAGDVQALDNVPPADLARLRTQPNLTLASKVSYRLIFLYLDAARDRSPYVTDKAGKPLAANPLKDRRVREAISHAIDRQAISDKIMDGLGQPTGNLVPSKLFGYDPALPVPAYNPALSKRLLAQAGYPDGFGITLHTPNNRYVNDDKVAQAIAQMLGRVSIAARVESMPMSVYSARGSKGDFSFGLLGWGAQTGEASSPLRALAACPDAATGFGPFNWLNYCNPRVDALLKQALTTGDDRQRSTLLQQATALVTQDAALVPIHLQVATWAMKKGIHYVPRTDERTHAHEFTAD
nr:ABC transporter substrate-binding protein [Massilia forsythiae]